ncbi:MAG: AmmeMemoRadiSam system protein B, partial [Deltaproteobacteria bacterium]|nr:AmmeMemoRadiSam system protein B [Deltaproteobacteria bacterium]
VWNGGPWATPLGDVPIDAEAVDCLVASGAGFCPDTKAHLQEHSLEVLLPFLQVMNPKVRITPVTISGLPFAALQKAGEALAGVVGDAAVCGENILTIVSSDMSHYLPHEEAVEKDSLALSAAETLDPERLFGVVRENAISMCGIFPMTIALFASNRLGARAMDVVARATSGQTGRAFGAGMDKVVGYAGAVITR